MPDSVISESASHFPTSELLEPRFFTFRPKILVEKLKRGSQLGRVANSYSALAHAHMSGVKTREPHR